MGTAISREEALPTTWKGGPCVCGERGLSRHLESQDHIENRDPCLASSIFRTQGTVDKNKNETKD